MKNAVPQKSNASRVWTPASAALWALLSTLPVAAQANYGELRLKIEDPSAAGVQATVELSCAGNSFEQSFTSAPSGELSIHALPFGAYQIRIRKPGFAPFSTAVQLRSVIPVSESIHLAMGAVVTNVNVTLPDTLIDPQNPASVMQIGPAQIARRTSSLPGRSPGGTHPLSRRHRG